jgi:hypothetical protein
MKIVVLLVAASLPFALAGCSSQTCGQDWVVSNTSGATYSANGAITSSLGVSSQGSVMGLSASAPSANTLQLSGYVGNASFTFTVPNVPANGSAALTSASQAYFGDYADYDSNTSLSGTIDVTFSNPCAGGACALTVFGTLNGTATFPDGSTFSLDATPNYSEELQSYACGSQGYAE